MKNNKFFLILILIAIVGVVVSNLALSYINSFNQSVQSENVAVEAVKSQISADGSIHSKNESTLHFQVGGKIVYLPFKQGDSVALGQTIAMLDERVIEKNLQSAVDSYKNQKINYDVVNDFNGDRTLADTGLSVGARRQLETAINTLDQAQLASDIAQIAKEQAVLTSPINGILMQEDVTQPLVNITPLTAFFVADPSMPIFQANVLAQDIDFVSVGKSAKITIDGLKNVTISGIVDKVYPQKITFNNGSQGYQVDIVADELKNGIKLGQTGSVLIESNVAKIANLVPIWAVLEHQYVWVLDNNKAVLKKVTLGKQHGNMVEAIGLKNNEKIITNPKSIAEKHYSIL